jgi:L-asparaginase II
MGIKSILSEETSTKQKEEIIEINMDSRDYLPLVEVTRGSISESIHFGCIIVVDKHFNILFHYGNENLVAYMRSTAKPLQLLAMIENGGVERYNFSQEEIAIMCASHSGSDEHVRVIRSLQKKIGISETHLQCGTHPPFDKETNLSILRGEKENSCLRHDCSGKHSGMLALAKMLDAPLDTYLDINNPTQDLILQTCAEMFDFPQSSFNMGTDGCSAPVFAVPMKNAARAYALLCQPYGLQEARSKACHLITSSMMAHPFMVSGNLRFDYDLMRTHKGKLIAKTGAEGYFGIGILPNIDQLNNPGLGIMLKVSDGDQARRARPIIMMEMLKHMNLLNENSIDELQKYLHPQVINSRKISVGDVRLTPQFKEALNSWKFPIWQ